jgi:xanthine dehydrogenase accessory factor
LILQSLQQGTPVMLLYVLESFGSSPGRQGFSMAVNRKAEMAGSLGGGIMEHKFVEMAKARLAEDATEISIYKQVHNKTAATHQSGMICSGEQTILVYSIWEKDALAVTAIISSLEKNKTGLLALSPAGIDLQPESTGNTETSFLWNAPGEWRYQEVIGYKNHLFIVGAGHCALALSRLMRAMDFYIHLFDDRHNLKTMIENNFVHEKEILEDYEQLSQHIDAGENNYIVIMTFGYRTDAIALRALINKDFRYLGLLGSKMKTKKMLEDLAAEGYDAAALQRIHAPVGIPIKSKTPEEVAVSVAAEIIMIKNQ